MSNTMTNEVRKSRYQTLLDGLIQTDDQIAQRTPKPSVKLALESSTGCLIDLMEIAFNGYAERQALGERAYTIIEEEGGAQRNYLQHFETISYSQLQQRIKTLASLWQGVPQYQLHRGERVCILGFAGIDYEVIDMACIYSHAVAVPLQSTMTDSELEGVFSTVEPALIAATVDDIETAAKHALQQSSVRQLIVFDYDSHDTQNHKKLLAAQSLLDQGGRDIKLYALPDLLAYDVVKPWVKPVSDQGADRMAAIVHSSGSTGTPKGAVISEFGVSIVWNVQLDDNPIVAVGLAPLNHLLGRNYVLRVLAQGGTLYFTLKPDLSTLFEDMRLVRPTQASFFPRILELIYQHYQSEVSRLLSAFDESPAPEQEQNVRAEVKAAMRYFLGDRLCQASVGGAPTAADVRAFIKEVFDIPLTDGYGSTEAGNGAITLQNIVQRPKIIDYKLRNVPELGYYTTDKPYPRGEFCFKSIGQVTEYYKQPEATAELVDDEGFLLSGDIVEERGQDHVVIIDRRKDVLKLSQGEYVAIGKLGTQFEASSSVIKQIYIYGTSQQSYLVAVIVPDATVIESLLGDNPEEPALRALIRDELQQAAHQNDLKSFEVPRDFIIEHEPFSQNNGLLSSVRKRLRPALKNKYGEQLEALYSAEEDNQRQLYQALKDPASGMSVIERLAKLLAIHLKLADVDINKAYTFAQWGGDSLASVGFSLSIEEVFQVSFGADAILSPSGNLANWASQIEKQLSGDDQTIHFQTVHDTASGNITRDELQLSSFIAKDTLQQASSISNTSHDKPQCVLLTGANGFLGRFVCLEWLEKLAAGQGQLICLIRATSDEAAKARLDTVFSGLDSQLEQRYQALARHHLQVIAGDVSEPRLGLSQRRYDDLAGQVDRISHVAALVNHRLSYDNLFKPNVAGTAALIGLALTQRQKPIDFVSTEAVFPLLDTTEGLSETSPLCAQVQLHEGYAAGYGASKWASEQLLRRANEQFDLPVNVFRGDMMLAHRHYQGQMNADDMFTRLFFSLIRCGVAPSSFYADAGRGHYNGTPVDVVAACVAGAVDHSPAAEDGAHHSKYAVYNIENYHYDDGCSLDAFTDWIIEAGFPIEKIPDYEQWHRTFAQRLAALPEPLRQQSAYDILSTLRHPAKVEQHVVACDNFKALLKTLAVGPDIPHLSKSFIKKCISDMQLQGLI